MAINSLSDAISDIFGVTPEVLRGKSRLAEIMEARYAEAAILYHELGMGKRRIARLLGLHPTSPAVADRIAQHESMHFTVPSYRQRYEVLRQRVQAGGVWA